MLTIRRKQMDMLELLKIDTLAENLLPLMREHHQQIFRFYTDAQCIVWIKNQLLYLKSFGFASERAIHRGLHVLAMFGENFERSADPQWALSILNNSLNPDTKALLLTYEAIKELKKQAE